VLGRRWAQKPPVGTAIDWGAPPAQRVMGFYALNEGTGPSACDACRNIDLTATGYGSTNPWAAGPSGAGLVATGLAQGFVGTIPARLQLGWPMTIMCGVRLVGPGTGNQRIFALTPNDNNAPPYGVIQFYSTGSTIKVDFADGSGIVEAASFAFTQGVDYVLGFTVTPTSWAFYVDGAGVASGTGTFATPAWTATAQLVAGGWPAIGGTCACNPRYWGAWWNHDLSADEHARIGRDVNAIWRIFSRQEWARTRLAAAWLSYPRAASVLRPVQLPTTDLTCYLD
jgi:hypothetical protein